MVSFGLEKSPGFSGGKKRERSNKKEGGLYASPVDVKTLLKTIPKHRKNATTRSGVAVGVMG